MPLEKIFTNKINLWAWLKNMNNKDIGIFTLDGVPVNGTSGTGAGKLGPGAVVINTLTGIWYSNRNTKASPTWTAF